MQIETCRTRLEEFQQSLNRELLRFHSGLKRKLELVPLYGDYSDLFCTANIREVEAAIQSEPIESRRKNLQRVLAILLDGHFEYHAAAIHQEIARLEAEQTLRFDGSVISISEVPALVRREPDAAKRRKLYERFADSLEELAELRGRKFSLFNSAAAALGFSNYIEARERISGVRYEELLNRFQEILGRMEDRYFERMRVSMESTLGIPLQETGSWDVAHWEGKHDKPAVFTAKSLRGAVESTMDELRIRPENPDAITLDLEQRPGKHSSPACVPVMIPQDIQVIVTPGDGARHYAALLHEFGHAHHFAWTSPSLPAEHRLAGDRALTEAYGFLFESFL